MFESSVEVNNKVIVDEDYVKVMYERENKLAFVEWLKRPNFEQYQFVANQILDYSLTSPVNYYLSNNTKQGVVSKEMKEWWRDVSIPRAISRGLKRGASIIDDNPFRMFYMNLMLKYSSLYQLPFKTFYNETQAREWLLNDELKN